MPIETTYRSSGVNLELGNTASEILYNASKITWENRKGKLGEVKEFFKDFSGPRGVHIGGLPIGSYYSANTDGVGTKVILAERTTKHDTVAFDLFGMVCDDAVRRGQIPLTLVSTLDIRSLGEEGESYMDYVRQLAVGYINAAKEAGVAVIDGESAELGATVTGYSKLPSFLTRLGQAWKYAIKGEEIINPGFHYNWSACVVPLFREERIIAGHKIKAGDKLVALREDGFRSNGLSLVRRVMEKKYGREWHEETYNGRNLAEWALHPTKIYCKAVSDMFGGFYDEPKVELHGIVHITGGGIPEKLGRVLKPTGMGADITDPFEPCELMLHCQKIGNTPDDEAYRTFNMGQGMILITDNTEGARRIAGEHGIKSKVIGEVSETKGIRIKNRGYFNPGTVLEFTPS